MKGPGGARRVPLIDLLKTRYPDREEKELFSCILRGHVIVDGQKALKPGASVSADAVVQVPGVSKFVSRGGDKLEAALTAWNLDCRGAPWLDAGCSTGGFTDCLLQHGAPMVYAVDVGVGQLDWRLRTDARVRVMEGTNILAVSAAQLDPAPGRAAADLSFRSLLGAARHILRLTTEGRGIFLFKPQFELRDAAEDFRGVVKDPGEVRRIGRELLQRLAEEGVRAEKALPSPVTGRKGNREYLLMLTLGTAAEGEETVRDLPE